MENTKNKIIQAATDLFVKKGFSGTSISEIAKAAGINQSLIYHHIGNKQELWHAVKNNLLPQDKTASHNQKKEFNSLDSFLDNIIDSRIEFYEKDHRVKRLIKWQNLENDEENMQSHNQSSPHSWISIIQELQDRNKITKKYSAEFYGYFIFSLVNTLIFDHFKIIKEDTAKKKLYILKIKEIIFNNLKAK